MNNNIIIIASDHAGVILKNYLIDYLKENKIEFVDLGCYTEEAVDYPDYAQKLANKIKENPLHIGVLICGSGIGMSIAANRFKFIRAALCITPEMAELSRKHNDANILVLGARLISTDTALNCLNTFMNTEFSKGDHHINRINKLNCGE